MSGEFDIEADEARLSQALSNLIANAVQHGSSDPPISVTVRNEKDRIVWSIHNQRTPIAPSQLADDF